MKNLITVFSLVIMGLLCSAAFADMQNGPIVTRESNALFSAKAATVTTALTSNVSRMFGNVRATAVFGTMSSNNGLTTNTTVLQNGAAALQCGMTVSGPWTTMKDSLGTSVSLANQATSTTFELNTLCNFIRATWTPTAISTNRTFYLYLLGGQ